MCIWFTELQDLRMSGRYKLRMKISKWTHTCSCTWTLLDGVTMTVDDSWHWRVANSLTKSYSRNLVPCDLCRITSVNTTSILVVWLRKSWVLWLEGVWFDLEHTNSFCCDVPLHSMTIKLIYYIHPFMIWYLTDKEGIYKVN